MSNLERPKNSPEKGREIMAKIGQEVEIDLNEIKNSEGPYIINIGRIRYVGSNWEQPQADCRISVNISSRLSRNQLTLEIDNNMIVTKYTNHRSDTAKVFMVNNYIPTQNVGFTIRYKDQRGYTGKYATVDLMIKNDKLCIIVNEYLKGDNI